MTSCCFLVVVAYGGFACFPPEGRVRLQVSLRQGSRDHRRLGRGSDGDDRRLHPRVGIQQVRSVLRSVFCSVFRRCFVRCFVRYNVRHFVCTSCGTSCDNSLSFSFVVSSVIRLVVPSLFCSVLARYFVCSASVRQHHAPCLRPRYVTPRLLRSVCFVVAIETSGTGGLKRVIGCIRVAGMFTRLTWVGHQLVCMCRSTRTSGKACVCRYVCVLCTCACTHNVFLMYGQLLPR